MKKYKEYSPVNQQIPNTKDQDGEIHKFAQGYLDEKELAEHKYRSHESQKSLRSFAEGDGDIYDQKRSDKKSSYQEIREKLDQESKRVEQERQLHQDV